MNIGVIQTYSRISGASKSYLSWSHIMISKTVKPRGLFYISGSSLIIAFPIILILCSAVGATQSLVINQ